MRLLKYVLRKHTGIYMLHILTHALSIYLYTYRYIYTDVSIYIYVIYIYICKDVYYFGTYAHASIAFQKFPYFVAGSRLELGRDIDPGAAAELWGLRVPGASTPEPCQPLAVLALRGPQQYAKLKKLVCF